MSQSVKYILFFCVYLFANGFVLAQKTNIYSDVDVQYKSAIDLFSKEKYAAAKRQFRQVIAQSTYDYQGGEIQLLLDDARFHEALCSVELKQPEAVPLIEHYMATHPNDVKNYMAQVALVKFHFDNKDYDKVVLAGRNMEVSFLRFDKQAQFQYMMGYSHFIRKNYSQALGFFAQIAEKESIYKSAANYYIACIYHEQKQYDRALQAFLRLEGSKEYGKEVPVHIAQIYYQQQQYDKLLAYALPKLTDGSTVKNKDEIAHVVGQTYYQKNDFKNAFIYLKEFVKNGGKNIQSSDYYQFGITAYKVEEYDDAINALQKIANKKDATGQNAAYLMADCHLKKGEKELARNGFLSASKLSFDKDIQEISALNYAKLSYELGVQSVALDALKEFITTYPNSIYREQADQIFATALLSSRNYKEALLILDGIKIKTPTIVKALQKAAYYTGVEMFNENNFSEAMALFNKSLDKPSDPKIEAMATFWKAETFYRQNRPNDAKATHQKFLTLAANEKDLDAENSVPVSNYTIGYTYFNTKNYADALPFFNKSYQGLSAMPVSELKNTYLETVVPDVALRLADCNFSIKNYTQALNLYTKIASTNQNGSDYARYQKAIIAGLMGKNDDKIATLQEFVDNTTTTNNANSTYTDNALMELATTYINKNDNLSAIKYLDRLINTRPNSPYHKTALVQKALILYNEDKFENALAIYKQVVSQYPNTEQSQDALLGIKNIYVETNNVDEYFKYIKNVPSANVSLANQDSISFEAAEQVIAQNNCDKTIVELSKYIQRFAKGIFADKAFYLRGECYAKLKQNDKAIADFNIVGEMKQNAYKEKALLKAGNISFEQKKYDNALDYYNDLTEIAENKQTILEALLGAMRSLFVLNQYPQTTQKAIAVANYQAATPIAKQEAKLYAAKSAVMEAKYTEAIVALNQVYDEAKNQYAAEAKYYVALAQLALKQYEQCQNTAFELAENLPSYDYWVGKAFLVLADSYIAQNNLFQAKATLESLIDNHQSTEIKQNATDKLKQLGE